MLHQGSNTNSIQCYTPNHLSSAILVLKFHLTQCLTASSFTNNFRITTYKILFVLTFFLITFTFISITDRFYCLSTIPFLSKHTPKLSQYFIFILSIIEYFFPLIRYFLLIHPFSYLLSSVHSSDYAFLSFLIISVPFSCSLYWYIVNNRMGP